MGNPAEAEQEARLPLSKKVQVLCTAAIFFQNVAFVSEIVQLPMKYIER
jgi:hypothetical protein